jgi:hypothetical protein
LITLDGNSTEADQELVYEGSTSLNVTGGACFLFRQIGFNCPSQRVTLNITEGDTFRISLKVRMHEPNTVFQIYTAHYHPRKVSRWAIPEDDSHIVSRTLVKEADEWVTIEAIHTVGDDWTFEDTVLKPNLCNHYQLRFRTANSDGGFFIDDVRVEKIGSLEEDSVKRAFLKNPDFVMDHKYWKYAPNR